MAFPITTGQLIHAVEDYNFNNSDAKKIAATLLLENRIQIGGSLAHLPNPTDPDAPLLTALLQHARGGSHGSVNKFKIREFLELALGRSRAHGASAQSGVLS